MQKKKKGEEEGRKRKQTTTTTKTNGHGKHGEKKGKTGGITQYTNKYPCLV